MKRLKCFCLCRIITAGILSMSLVGCSYLSNAVVGDSQSVPISAGDLRAKYVVYSLARNKAIAQGLTPDVVPLQKSGSYRFEIMHPDTGEVYSAQIKGTYDPFIGWKLSAKEVEAPF